MLLGALLVLCVVSLGPLFSDARTRADLTTVACAARSLHDGADPYRAISLAACEREQLARRGLTIPPGFVWQAPFPPLVLAAAEPFSRIPRPYSDVLDDVAVAALSLVLVWTYVRLGNVGWPAAVALVTLSIALHELFRGQLALISLAALGLAAFAAREGRRTPCCAALGVAIFEPHLALPAIVGAAVALPAFRTRIALLLAVLAGCSFVATSPALDVEYVRAVLHAHARSELYAVEQYGLSMPLAALGLAPGLALALASVQDVVFTIAGIVAGLFLTRKTGDAAFALATPVAFAVIGGPFIHMTQIAAAYPLALLLIRHVPSLSIASVIAILPIALDPEDVFGLPLFALAAVVATVTLLLVRGAAPRAPRAAYASAAGAVAIALALRAYAEPVLALVRATGPYPDATALIRNPATLADDSTRLYIETAWNVRANLQHLWLNGFVWLGLCVLAGIAIATAGSRRAALAAR